MLEKIWWHWIMRMPTPEEAAPSECARLREENCRLRDERSQLNKTVFEYDRWIRDYAWDAWSKCGHHLKDALPDDPYIGNGRTRLQVAMMNQMTPGRVDHLAGMRAEQQVHPSMVDRKMGDASEYGDPSP